MLKKEKIIEQSEEAVNKDQSAKMTMIGQDIIGILPKSGHV